MRCSQPRRLYRYVIRLEIRVKFHQKTRLQTLRVYAFDFTRFLKLQLHFVGKKIRTETPALNVDAQSILRVCFFFDREKIKFRSSLWRTHEA